MKNQAYTTHWGRRFVRLSGGLVLAAGLTNLPAADRTWNGGGDQYNWSDANNWGGTAPVASDSLFFGGTTGLYQNNDLGAGTVFNGLTFNADAGNFTLSGNDLKLGGGVTNNSASDQIISLNLDNNGANRVANAAVGALEFAGSLSHNQIVKEGTNSVTLSGTVDNSSLGATVNNGTLILAKTGSVRSLGSTATVNTNGVLRIPAGVATDQIHYNQRIIMNGGVFQLQNAKEEFASLSGADPGSVLENGLDGTTGLFQIGGGNNHRGIYSGMIRDGMAGVVNVEVYRANNLEQFNGTNSYTGTTTVDNTQGTGFARLIMNGLHTGGGAYTINGHATTADRQAALGGSGTISASSMTFGTRGWLSPGGALSADLSDAATFSDTTAILTLNNDVLITNGTVDVQLNGTTAGSGYDQVVIGGTGRLVITNGNLQLTLGFTPANGAQFTIVHVQGTDSASTVGQFASLNGVPTDLSQGATFVDPGSGKNFRISYRAEGSTFDAGEGSGNDIMLEVVAPVGGQNLTWRGDGTDNNWDVTTTANWWNGTALTTFTNGDFVMLDDTGDNTMPINLVGDLTPASLDVNATKDYVLAGAGRLTGTVIITKTNSGTLSLVTENTPTGTTLINQGTVQIGTNGTSGSLSGVVTVNSGGVLAYNRSDDVTIGTVAFGGTGGFVHNGDGKLIITANLSSSFMGRGTNSGGLLQFGDGTSTFGQMGGEVNVPAGKNVYYNFANGTANIANSFSGSGTVDMEGGLGQTLVTATTAVSSNFTGTINVVSGGRLHASDGNSGYNLGNGSTVNVPVYSQVWLDRSATAYNQVFNIAGTGYISDSTPYGALRVFGCTLNGTINLTDDARIGGSISGGTILGAIHGSHQLEILGTDPGFVLSMGPTNGINDYASTLLTAATLRALNSNAISAGPLTIDSAGNLRLYGNNLTIASLASINTQGGTGATVQNTASAAAVLTVGTDNTDSQFDGVFLDNGSGPLGLTKVGTGTLTLTGVNSNTGPVAVNGGTLALSGSGSFGLAARLIVNATLDVNGIGGTLTLNNGRTLGGNGNVAGNVVADAGSTVSPGASVGTLTVSGNVTLAGQLVMELDRTNSPANCDHLVASGGTITYGGSLLVTNIGPALQVNDTFQVFPAGVSGFGANVTIATNDANGMLYTWQNDIATLGSVKLLSATVAVNTTPTNIVATVSGGNLNLSWPADHTGWSLQAQTNSVGVGLSTNWTTIGYEGTNAVSLPIDPANPAVFYRLFRAVP